MNPPAVRRVKTLMTYFTPEVMTFAVTGDLVRVAQELGHEQLATHSTWIRPTTNIGRSLQSVGFQIPRLSINTDIT